jgi:hypothetical protein
MKVSEEPVCIHLIRQNPIFTSLHLRSPVHVVPPQMQGGQNWILLKETIADRFFLDSHWLEIWKNHFCPMGPNGGSVAMDSAHSMTPIGQDIRSADGNAAFQITKRTQRSVRGTNVNEKRINDILNGTAAS